MKMFPNKKGESPWKCEPKKFPTEEIRHFKSGEDSIYSQENEIKSHKPKEICNEFHRYFVPHATQDMP